MHIPRSASLIILSLALLSLPTRAEWMEASGEATIINGNTAQAREEAINQAVSYATLSTGIQISSEQQTSNGNLTQNNFAINRNAQAISIQLVSERIQGNKIYVSLRLDLNDDPTQQCPSGQLKAAILIPQAQIKDRTQLRYGQLSGFEEVISEKLGSVIEDYSSTGFSHTHAKELLDIKQDLVDIRGYRLPSWLSEITDSQYILQPQIMDISMEPVQATFLGFWDEAPLRQFQFKLSLYHGISGEEVWSKSYSTSAPWEFEEQAIIAPNTDRFWRSSYGKNITKLMQQATHDLDSTLNCRPLLGQVVSRQADRIILNLGRKHGIRVGDKFQVVLQQNLPDRLNEMRAVATKSRATVKIEQVSEESSTAVLLDQNAAYNVQINDIALKI
ncbi:flagellar assembly protein FlgT [Shewanella baltica]|uniref:flagellar assembly protein FlgT n=1 Tax=Shewanella baltica TaxID=62322 RepID=UPI00217E41E7|nr:flagellar assembly protein FlgT [Shewanella baltica]MCS6095103.1 flagellar biosynthesis protein FlgT [Shewanella baltica]MCS6180409.1 flagellar biosynthesis protein FlgT [Shewanella baltica]MCS6226211.1 flagellar biosynthesis protein FlgT [Shewanella baltica]MCS6256633.1 flagellar biosynthesis protein FlgT [Shewanella baltica]